MRSRSLLKSPRKFLKKSERPSVFSATSVAHIAYIGIGSNLGEKLDYCERAISKILKTNRQKLLAKSSFYKTQAIGYTSQDWFVNGVIKIETDLEAYELLQTLKAIESQLGRAETFPWGPRTIDLDILFFDDAKIDTERLQIPHPLIQDRQFVLVPLAEIDRNFIHPVLKKTIQELLNNLKEDQGVKKL